VRFVPLAEGRFFNDADLADRRRVVVLGAKGATLLFPGRPMLGESITINDTQFTVIGRVATISRGNNDFDNQKVYIPLTTMLELFAMKGDNLAQNALSSIQYQPATHGDTTAAVPAVHRVIAARHGFDPSLKDAFDEWDSIQEEHMIGAIFNAMDIFLGGVGIVTLALGAVGIINIMLVSVTERTREIGLLKALGATKRSILAQFFWEGLLLTAVSGIIASLSPAEACGSSSSCSPARFPALILRAWSPGRPRWPSSAWSSAAWWRDFIQPAKQQISIRSRLCDENSFRRAPDL